MYIYFCQIGPDLLNVGVVENVLTAPTKAYNRKL